MMVLGAASGFETVAPDEVSDSAGARVVVFARTRDLDCIGVRMKAAHELFVIVLWNIVTA